MAEKKETLYETVKMQDGREMKFAGKRRLEKDYIIDESKIEFGDDGSVMLAPGAILVRFDWRDGQTRLYPLVNKLVPQAAGHGIVQKGGDNLASPADKPMSYDDMVLATDDLFSDLAKGQWAQKREGSGGSAGASIVIQALCEKFGKTPEFMRGFVDKRLETLKAQGQETTRATLYAGYRASPELQPIIKRLEDEKAAKEASKAKIDVTGDFSELASV